VSFAFKYFARILTARDMSMNSKLGTYKGFFEAVLDEKKKRLKRVTETMHHLFSCHSELFIRKCL
jgi:hypothetical protein